MKIYTILFSLIVLLVFQNPLVLQSHNYSDGNGDEQGYTPGWSIGVKASTLGFGFELSKSFNKHLNLRLGGSYYQHNITDNIFEDYVAEQSYATVGSVSLIADWHVLSFMYFSGGLLYNMTKADVNEAVTETPAGGGEEEYVGSLNYILTPNEICPYLGIGFGNAVSRSKGVSFNLDLGVVYQGSPKLAMSSTGDVSQEYFDKQEKMFKDSMKNYRFFPFVNFQLNFRIF